MFYHVESYNHSSERIRADTMAEAVEKYATSWGVTDASEGAGPEDAGIDIIFQIWATPLPEITSDDPWAHMITTSLRGEDMTKFTTKTIVTAVTTVVEEDW